jgi:hypothetical protein
VKNLVVEVNAKYLKGMLNNPDIQPNPTINRWIASILLFDVKLVYVPAIHHTAADRLSRRTPAPEDPLETNDFEEWIDDSYGFFMELANWRLHHLFPSALTMPQQFTELIHASASASTFITEETSEDNSDAAANIPRNLRASAADALSHPNLDLVM